MLPLGMTKGVRARVYKGRVCSQSELESGLLSHAYELPSAIHGISWNWDGREQWRLTLGRVF